ncbi:MAG TPA: SDR family oxidoreductase [Bdellovibrionales bacterium]|nr:SDR family oxidoreductase [Bdellovibrionales bacterium]
MKVKLKPLTQQVIVITGATSGIGLATAKLAARRGAKVVLNSRNEGELQRIADELRNDGGDVSYCAADVADSLAMEAVADKAINDYGRIDTWINNAGVSIYGRLDEVPLEEKRRLFDVNFWGVVHGCRAALPHLKKTGGAIINIGSALSERVLPLQGMYCASKHAVKAYTDALRMELEKDKAPISVTLIKPAAIDTPYTLHARNHLEKVPTNPPPVYSAQVAADAILYCAEHPMRDIFVGGSAKLFSLLETIAPRLTDKYMERTMFKQQQTKQRANPLHKDALYSIVDREGDIEGAYSGHVMKSSVYTSAVLHPVRSAALAALAVAAATMAFYVFKPMRMT